MTPLGPLSAPQLGRSVIAAVEAGADGAVPCVPVSDTIKQRQDDGQLVTLERARLLAVQTPQAFSAAALRAAHARGGEATDDAALVEAIGGRVVSVPGEASQHQGDGSGRPGTGRDAAWRSRAAAGGGL